MALNDKVEESTVNIRLAKIQGARMSRAFDDSKPLFAPRLLTYHDVLRKIYINSKNYVFTDRSKDASSNYNNCRK